MGAAGQQQMAKFMRHHVSEECDEVTLRRQRQSHFLVYNSVGQLTAADGLLPCPRQCIDDGRGRWSGVRVRCRQSRPTLRYTYSASPVRAGGRPSSVRRLRRWPAVPGQTGSPRCGIGANYAGRELAGPAEETTLMADFSRGKCIPDVAGAAHIPPGGRATAGEGNLARTRSKGGST